MTQLQKVLGVVGTLVAIAGGLLSLSAHVQQDAVARDRDRNHIRQLEKILVSEWPQWSPAIDWDDK